MMFWQHRKMTAQELARDFAVTAQAFADMFVQYVAAESHSGDILLVDQRRRETCAAVWAAISATFDASALSHDERIKVVPIVRDALLPYWQKHCAKESDLVGKITERSTHYLRSRDSSNQLRTATGIVNDLLASIDTQAAKALPVKTLTALLAHRMLSDLRRLNEIKSMYAIE
jgi:hypothetical protein